MQRKKDEDEEGEDHDNDNEDFVEQMAMNNSSNNDNKGNTGGRGESGRILPIFPPRDLLVSRRRTLDRARSCSVDISNCCKKDTAEIYR